MRLNGFACADGGFTCLYCAPTAPEFKPSLVCAHDDDWPAAAIWMSKESVERFPIVAGILFLVRTMIPLLFESDLTREIVGGYLSARAKHRRLLAKMYQMQRNGNGAVKS